jgi:hypothetical protein
LACEQSEARVLLAQTDLSSGLGPVARWPCSLAIEHMPTLDFEIVETFLSKDAANEGARNALAVWEAHKQPGELVSDMLHEGSFVGQLCNSKGVPKQILMVYFNDRKIGRNGIIRY